MFGFCRDNELPSSIRAGSVSWTSELPSDQRVPVLTDGGIPILSVTICFTCPCAFLLYLLIPFLKA